MDMKALEELLPFHGWHGDQTRVPRAFMPRVIDARVAEDQLLVNFVGCAQPVRLDLVEMVVFGHPLPDRVEFRFEGEVQLSLMNFDAAACNARLKELLSLDGWMVDGDESVLRREVSRFTMDSDEDGCLLSLTTGLRTRGEYIDGYEVEGEPVPSVIHLMRRERVVLTLRNAPVAQYNTVAASERARRG